VILSQRNDRERLRPLIQNPNHKSHTVIKGSNGIRVDQGCYRQNWKPLRKELGLMVGDLFSSATPA